MFSCRFKNLGDYKILRLDQIRLDRDLLKLILMQLFTNLQARVVYV